MFNNVSTLTVVVECTMCRVFIAVRACVRACVRAVRAKLCAKKGFIGAQNLMKICLFEGAILRSKACTFKNPCAHVQTPRAQCAWRAAASCPCARGSQATQCARYRSREEPGEVLPPPLAAATTSQEQRERLVVVADRTSESWLAR